MNYGWICPLCGKALAPWVRECGCYRAEWYYPSWPYYYDSGGTSTPDWIKNVQIYNADE